ncbi:MAG: hypothetical protein K6A44_01855 [bacterium]|nr:hypothetical protein [bacterium]
MNITTINNSKIEYPNRDNKTSFGGPLLSSAFMAINRHEIIGVSGIDLGSMVIPRTLVDFTRNKEAGTETLFRESSSTVTNASIGLAGIGAAALLALGLRKKNYGVDFKAITANSDTIDAMANLFKEVKTNSGKSGEELTRAFLEKVFEDVRGLAGNSEVAGQKIWYKLLNESRIVGDSVDAVNPKQSIIQILLNEQKNKSFKLSESSLGQLKTYLSLDLPSAQELKVNLGGREIITKGEHFFADVNALTKAFTRENVIKTFDGVSEGVSSEFVKDLKKLCKRKTIFGLAAICALGLSWQAINRHMTQKRTGIKGFVGDPNYGKDNTNDNKKDNTFLPLKALTTAIMGFYMFKTINAKNLKDFVSKIQFKGALPTMEQIKLVYGSVILGRLLAARDKNELRESAFRDFMGFTNFLVIGALLTKWFVNKHDKSLINYDINTHGKGLWNWIKNSSIKTHEEVLNNAFKTDMLKDKGVKSIRELYKHNWIQKGSDVAKKLAILDRAKLLAIGYACVVLGIIIPVVNKYMTQWKTKKLANQKTQNVPSQQLPVMEKKADSKAQTIIHDYLNKKIAG